MEPVDGASVLYCSVLYCTVLRLAAHLQMRNLVTRFYFHVRINLFRHPNSNLGERGNSKFVEFFYFGLGLRRAERGAFSTNHESSE